MMALTIFTTWSASARVLEDGHRLLAADDGFDVRQVRILARDDRHMAGTVASGLQRGLHAERRGVIRAEDGVYFRIRVVRREDVVHALLRFRLIPVRRRALLARRLAALHDELTFVDVRLQDIHRTLEEEHNIVVIERTRRNLEVVRAFAFFQAELFLNVLALDLADAVVVERRIVRDGIRIHDEAVVRDDLAAGGLRLVEDG